MDIEAKIRKAAEGFETLSADDCIQMSLAARSLSLEECYDMLLVDPEQLTPAERKFAEQIHRRGRAVGVKDASDKLFVHMSTRQGGNSALEYLKQMSGEFAVELSAAPKSGFQFNVSIPDVTVPSVSAKVSKS